MTTLDEVEAAVERLSDTDKQELLFRLAALLRERRVPLPAPRDFTIDEMNSWIAEDQADMQRLRATGKVR